MVKIHNADVMIREDVTIDDFIDVLLGTRKYLPCLYCYNKIDSISLEEVDRLARLPHTVVISCELDLNLDTLKARMWEEMGLIRIYTKRRTSRHTRVVVLCADDDAGGEKPDVNDPLILKKDSTVEQVCSAIHRVSLS